MLTRRALLTGGVLTGAVNADASAPQAGSNSNTDEKVFKVLEEIRDQMRLTSGANLPVLDQIRELQRQFLKGRGKFPDFMEIGIDVWDSLVNWHVRTGQLAQVQRAADGRYAMAVFQTNLVLRHDVANNYIGQPYDAK